MTEQPKSRTLSILGTLAVAVTMAFAYAEFQLWAGEQVLHQTSVSFREGSTETVVFEVDSPGTRHRLKVLPLQGGDGATDARYSFEFELSVTAPDGGEVLSMSDTFANHRDRMQVFTPKQSGTHTITITTRKGDHRADIVVWGDIRQKIVPLINDLTTS